MKNIIIGAIAAAITAGTLIAAPPALAEPQDPTEDPTQEVTDDGPFGGPFEFPVDFPRLMNDPTYGPRGPSGGVARSTRPTRSQPRTRPRRTGLATRVALPPGPQPNARTRTKTPAQHAPASAIELAANDRG